MPVALAVDLGGTKVEAALVTEDGALLPASRHRRPTGRDATSGRLEAAVRDVVAAALAAAPAAALAGAGVGSAGPVQRAAGLVSPLNLPAWRAHPLRDLVADAARDRLAGADVRLELDGIAVVLAEHWRGAGRGVDNLLGMVLSTGVGGGLILDSRVVFGHDGNAGHIGHVEVPAPPDPGVRRLEDVASGTAAVAWARAHGFTGRTGEELASAYARGESVARAAIARAGTALGHGIASTAAVAGLELVVVGGGFSRATPDLIRDARTVVADYGFAPVRATRIVPSALGDEGPLIGAGALVHATGALD